MSRLDSAPEIIELAQELGLDSNAPWESILRFCRQRVDEIVEDAGGVENIEELETLITRKLRLVFEEIHGDEDFARLGQKYAVEKGEPGFAGLPAFFNDSGNPTFGTLLQRNNAGPDDPDKFVAVIDCRGEKHARRFFTRWHEIAHLLTTHSRLLEPVFRSAKDPTEKLMDDIAGDIGYYEPIFLPVFQRAMEGQPHLTFAMVDAVIASGFSTASFQATLFACIRHFSSPVIYLEAAISYKKAEFKRIEERDQYLFDDDLPQGELRAVTIVRNDAARLSKFHIFDNIRIPKASIISRIFDGDLPVSSEAYEDLNQWESTGRTLKECPVFVQARKVSDRVVAIIQPAPSKEFLA